MAEITSLSQLDLNGTYSYADYLSWKFEEATEIIKGKILPMAAPSRKHQQISRDLNGIFYNYFKKHPFQFHLTNEGIYSLPTIYIHNDVLDCVIFPSLKIDLTEVFK
jgi:Uma2 family endonuclease